MDPATGAALAVAGTSLFSGIMGSHAQRRANEQNAALQREFAQNGIRWKVADAKAAGIHPLYALGANTHSPTASFQADTAIPAAVEKTGQSLGRAIEATSTAEEREFNRRYRNAQLIDAESRARISQAQATNVERASNPSLPSFVPRSGQGDIVDKPQERTATAPGAPFSEAGAVADVGWVFDSEGRLIPVPSADSKQRIEDSPHEAMHFVRNNIFPFFGGGLKPPGKYSNWKWDGVGFVPPEKVRDWRWRPGKGSGHWDYKANKGWYRK